MLLQKYYLSFSLIEYLNTDYNNFLHYLHLMVQHYDYMNMHYNDLLDYHPCII